MQKLWKLSAIALCVMAVSGCQSAPPAAPPPQYLLSEPPSMPALGLKKRELNYWQRMQPILQPSPLTPKTPPAS